MEKTEGREQKEDWPGLPEKQKKLRAGLWLGLCLAWIGLFLLLLGSFAIWCSRNGEFFYFFSYAKNPLIDLWLVGIVVLAVFGFAMTFFPTEQFWLMVVKRLLQLIGVILLIIVLPKLGCSEYMCGHGPVIYTMMLAPIAGIMMLVLNLGMVAYYSKRLEKEKASKRRK